MILLTVRLEQTTETGWPTNLQKASYNKKENIQIT